MHDGAHDALHDAMHGAMNDGAHAHIRRVDTKALTEARRVVVADGLCVTKRLQQRVALQDPLLDPATGAGGMRCRRGPQSSQAPHDQFAVAGQWVQDVS